MRIVTFFAVILKMRRSARKKQRFTGKTIKIELLGREALYMKMEAPKKDRRVI